MRSKHEPYCRGDTKVGNGYHKAQKENPIGSTRIRSVFMGQHLQTPGRGNKDVVRGRVEDG